MCGKCNAQVSAKTNVECKSTIEFASLFNVNNKYDIEKWVTPPRRRAISKQFLLPAEKLLP